jgi:hypothetical protein
MTVDRILERASRRSIELSTGVVVYLLGQLGPGVTAAVVGLSDARPLRHLLTDELEGREVTGLVANRLRILYRVIYAITEIFGPAAAFAFIRGRRILT